MSLLIGTSGWSYDEWIGPFYEKKQGMFTNYSKVFHTTEINSTFYSYPTERLVEGWRRTAPPGFVFAAKLPQVITHDKWLRMGEGIEDDMWRFIHLMDPLAEKLGPILIQLRPTFSYKESAGFYQRTTSGLWSSATIAGSGRRRTRCLRSTTSPTRLLMSLCCPPRST
jgi:uncharacterized protein YecE (DUF72 family)